MRGVIAWIAFWMLYWIILAAGMPSFFPSWVQSFIYGFGLASAIFGAAYTYHVVLLKDDIKRLETKNTDLEKQIQKEPAALPQTAPEPVSVVEVSEVHQETSRLLPAEAFKNKLPQDELKTQALKMANEIYKLIEKVEKDATFSPTSAYSALITVTTGEDPYVGSARKYYSEELHDIAVELKSKIRTPSELSTFPSGKYTNPRTLKDLKDIALDLRKIASSPREIY